MCRQAKKFSRCYIYHQGGRKFSVQSPPTHAGVRMRMRMRMRVRVRARVRVRVHSSNLDV